jgi:hypothetical protein
LAAIGLIWFLVGLALLLARAEGKTPWRSGVALISGVMLAAYLLLDVTSEAASYGATDLDPASSISATSASPISGWRWAASRSAALGSCCKRAFSGDGWAGGPSCRGLADSGPVRLVGRDLVRAVCTLLAVGDHCLHRVDLPKDRFTGGSGA